MLLILMRNVESMYYLVSIFVPINKKSAHIRMWRLHNRYIQCTQYNQPRNRRLANHPCRFHIFLQLQHITSCQTRNLCPTKNHKSLAVNTVRTCTPPNCDGRKEFSSEHCDDKSSISH